MNKILKHSQHLLKSLPVITLLLTFLALPALAEFTSVNSIVKDLANPESAVYDATNNVFYVSNVQGEAATKDNQGYISKISPEGVMLEQNWLFNLNAPKGMAVVGDKLYVADIDTLRIISISGRVISNSLKIEGATFLNDVTADAQGNVYISDTNTSTLSRLDADTLKLSSWLQDAANLPGLNGLLAEKDRLVVVTTVAKTGEGLLKAIDLGTKNITIIATVVPRGLFPKNTSLDGVTGDGQGGYYVTDYPNNKGFQVKADGSVTEILAGQLAGNPADLIYVPTKRWLLIPLMGASALKIFTDAATTMELKVNKIGSGKVTSDPAGIDCGATCAKSFDKDTKVTLTATADANAKFTRWGDDCTNTTDNPLSITMDKAKNCSATFTGGSDSRTPSLTVTVKGTGGSISSSTPAGISKCTSAGEATCTTNFTPGDVTLTASPAAGYTVSWSEGCTGGTGNKGTVKVEANKSASCTVTFTGGGGSTTITTIPSFIVQRDQDATEGGQCGKFIVSSVDPAKTTILIPVPKDVSVSYVINVPGTPGTATAADIDVAHSKPALSADVLISQGQPTGTVEVCAIDDTLVEPDETVAIEILTGSGHHDYQVTSPNKATLVIKDKHYPDVCIGVEPQIVAEGQIATLTFNVRPAPLANLKITLAIDPSSTAKQLTNYLEDIAAMELTVPKGQMIVTLPVTTIDNKVYEGDRTLVVTLAKGDYNEKPSCNTSVILVIKDNDPLPAYQRVPTDQRIPDNCFENQNGVLLKNICHAGVKLLPGAFDKNGAPAATSAEIIGGTAKGDGDYLTPTTVTVADLVVMAGSLKVSTDDVGKTADIIVAGIYYTAIAGPNGYIWYMLNGKDNTCTTCVEVWNFNSRGVASSLAQLTAFRTGQTLADYLPVQIYEGNLPYPGNLDVYLAYRITSGIDIGKIVFNSLPISVTIQP
jgi:hypothetical protein